MDDLISRQAAIDRINKQREHLQPDVHDQDKIADAAYRICAEFVGRLPSVQPEIAKRTVETAQNVSKSDLISRKAAIETVSYYIHNVDKEIGTGKLSKEDCRDAAENVLEALPSVQPEIIHCRDCVKYTAGRECSLFDYTPMSEDGYCSKSERRKSRE